MPNQLMGLGYASVIGGDVLPVAVGFAVDTNQQINRIVRMPYPAGATQTGLQPWSAPGKLPGTYVYPTTPACAASTTVVDGNVISQEISCNIGTDFACYALINGNLINLGGKFPPQIGKNAQLVMTSWPNGRVDVFGLEKQYLMQRTMLNGDFQWTPAWYQVGYFNPGHLSSAISCAPNLIDIAVSWFGGVIQVYSWNGSSWGVQNVSADYPASNADVVVASSAPGRLDLLAQDKRGILYHFWRIGDTWSKEMVGETGQGWAKPALASWGVNRLDVVVVGSDNSFYHKYFDGTTWYPEGTTNWNPIGGALALQINPVLVAPAENWLELFVIGTDNQWYTNSFNGNSWTGWVGHDVFVGN